MTNNIHISDELLAAYLDGNTNEAETQEVINALQKDSGVREVLEVSFNTYNAVNENYDTLPMMELAAESGNNICSVMCEAFILHHRGISFHEDNILKLAQEKHWLTPQGAPLYSIGQILAQYGLLVTRKYDANTHDIETALSMDNDVIVVVDSDKLHVGHEDLEDAPNHAIVITEIDNKEATFFDPELNSQLCIPITQFEDAWRESQNYMIRILQSIDDYKPQPINIENIPLNNDLLNLQEAIAENAHEVWAAARIKEGWSYGLERNDKLKKHPDLIPYSSLPDSEKEYDRLMALDTIKLVKKLGFDIVKLKRNE